METQVTSKPQTQAVGSAWMDLKNPGAATKAAGGEVVPGVEASGVEAVALDEEEAASVPDPEEGVVHRRST